MDSRRRLRRVLARTTLIGLPFVVGCGDAGSGSSAKPAAPTRAPDPVDAPAPPADEPPPAYCKPAASGLVEITKTPAGPYFVHHPTVATERAVPTILFIPGGPGSRDTASATFELWLSRGRALGSYRVVVPYAADGNLTDESERAVSVLDEVLRCYGGAADNVQLGGTSNGGRAAFALMLEHPDRFVSLLGAPGVFASATDAKVKAALAGKAVFNGAGELDDGWRPLVQATNQRLTGLGVDSVYVKLAGQSHILDERADQEVFFSFWEAHALRR